MTLLQIVGNCPHLIFGISAAERLNRQVKDRLGGVLVVHAASLLEDAAVQWLYENPDILLISTSGKPLAIMVATEDVDNAMIAIGGGESKFESVNVATLGQFFNRKLRRREALMAVSLEDQGRAAAEWLLFKSVYKGVTDLVTKWIWPIPAFLVSRICSRFGLMPNDVTITGLIFAILAGWLFFEGEISGALISGWIMTFLDTVDGKLARVTVTSSKLGDRLDHGVDYIHPPIWWLCLAHGLIVEFPRETELIWNCALVILTCYVLGRLIEQLFKKRIGYNQYMWERFDSLFRLVVARRNVLLLIMTVGLVLGYPVLGFEICAVWSVVSLIVQAVRYMQAEARRSLGETSSWLM